MVPPKIVRRIVRTLLSCQGKKKTGSGDWTRIAQLFIERRNKRWANIATVALRKLDQLHAAISLQDMRVPPANHLEALKGDRKGQHSVKINDQYRVCFTWKSDGAHGVEITDYH